MAQINKPSEHFETKLYTGNGTSQSISGLDFAPDFVWLKGRSVGWNQRLVNSIIGATKFLESNDNIAETTDATQISSFTSDGFSVGSGGATNQNGTTYASWNFKAGGTAVSNTDGDITSSVSANTTSGFSIVSYTGTGAVGTIGHGLGQLPAMIFFKNRSSATDWMVFHKNSQSSYNFSATAFLTLNSTADVNGAGVGGVMNDTAPTTSLFTVGNDSRSNGSGNSMIAYCFAEKKGFSKFGSYTGNGSTDGTFVYTGFKPAFIMVKSAVGGTGNWQINDSARDTFNLCNKPLYPNTNEAEGVDTSWDAVSNGFKMRQGFGSKNGSGRTYIYMAFAENPLVGSNNIPTTAR